MPAYSLLCGVQELVLAAAAVAAPDARIRPQAADGVDVAMLQLSDLHRVDVLYPLGVGLEGGERRVIGCGFVSWLTLKCRKPLQPPAPTPAHVCLLAGAWVFVRRLPADACLCSTSFSGLE